MIVFLLNYNVYLYDLQIYEYIEMLGKSKNVLCFVVIFNIVRDLDMDILEIISRFVVVVKRWLYFWSWYESELFEEVGEVVFLEFIRSVIWVSVMKFVCGMNGGYVMVDV